MVEVREETSLILKMEKPSFEYIEGDKEDSGAEAAYRMLTIEAIN
jgi:hypothetical protein